MLIRATIGGGGGGELDPSATYMQFSPGGTNTFTIDPSIDYIFVSMHQTTGVKGYCGYIHNGTLNELFNENSYITIQVQNSGTELYVKNNSTSAKLGTMLAQLE